ncbi:ribonuclease H-like domain-containing protein, partial [Tanacetum coccineum]
MVTHFRIGSNRPSERLNLHVSSVSPLPKSHRDAFNNPNWQNAMRDEYTAYLEAVLEGGPWLIRKSPIILKKWSMDTRLLKEELTRIPIWVNLHDVPIQVFKEDGSSLIATFIGKPVDLVDVVTLGITSLSGDGFTKETIRIEYEWRPPRCDICKIFGHVHDYFPNKVVSPPIVTTDNVVTPTVEKTNDDFQTVGKNKKRKGKSKSTNGGQFTGPSVKQNVRYEQKATTNAPMKGATYVGNTSQSSSMLKTTGNSPKKDNLSMSNSFSALNDEEAVKNVHDEPVNLIQNTKAGGSSSFTAAAARLVANGSTQLEGVDVDETFSPVVKLGTIRTVLSLAASRHWPIHQLDVKNAFLHGDLFETFYMHQPLEFLDFVHIDYVCLLKRSLYGLKQASRAWFQRFASYITRIIRSLYQEFAMTDLGPLNYFLGISVTRDSSRLFLFQKKYALEIRDRAHMANCNPSRTPIDTESKLRSDGDLESDPTLYQSLADSLQYLTFTRPNISYAVQQ